MAGSIGMPKTHDKAKNAAAVDKLTRRFEALTEQLTALRMLKQTAQDYQQQASNIAAQEKLQAATQERLQQQKAKQPSHGRSYGGPGLD